MPLPTPYGDDQMFIVYVYLKFLKNFSYKAKKSA